jgi:hypothetical protein
LIVKRVEADGSLIGGALLFLTQVQFPAQIKTVRKLVANDSRADFLQVREMLLLQLPKIQIADFRRSNNLRGCPSCPRRQ